MSTIGCSGFYTGDTVQFDIAQGSDSKLSHLMVESADPKQDMI